MLYPTQTTNVGTAWQTNMYRYSRDEIAKQYGSMLKTVLSSVIVSLLLVTTSCRSPVILLDRQEWYRDDLSDEQREVIASELTAMPFSRVAWPTLQALMECDANKNDTDGLPGLAESVGRPWQYYFDGKAKAYWMANKIWTAHVWSTNNPAVRDELLGLLPHIKAPVGVCHVLEALAYAPTDEVEKVLVQALYGENSHSSVRLAAAMLLFSKFDKNRYLPKVVSVVREQERCQCFLFGELANPNTWRTLSRKNQELLRETGFAILSDLPEANISEGYWVASNLGRFLKIENEFCPDMNLEGYRDKSGNLSPSWFADTVRNAIHWHRDTGERKLTEDSAPEM